MPQQFKDEYRAGSWGNKPRGNWENAYERPRDEENCPPNLDYKVIEQIADGVEKMILAWSHGEEREAYAPRSLIVDSGVSSPKSNMSRGLQKPIKSPLSEKSSQDEVGCNYMSPLQIQEVPGGITAEISINGNCPGAGMGSAISQIVSQAVKHTGAVGDKDMHAEKRVTESATYWYMEASKATASQGCRGPSSGEVEEQPESCGQIGGWNKEDKDAPSATRSESSGRPGGSAASSDQSTPQRSGSRHRHESRRSMKKDIVLLRASNSGAAEQPLTKQRPAPNSSSGSETQSGAQHVPAKTKEDSSEVARLAKVNLGKGSSLDVQFGSAIIDDELLEKKLAALTTMPTTPRAGSDELTKREMHRQCEDLQIALLECAMEYEIKTIELKIKLKNLQSTPKHSDESKSSPSEKDQMQYTKNSRELQIVESMKKQVFKLQREKGAVTKEYLSLQKKERKFEVQRRNLDDAILRVNRLQKELVKKDQELLDCQLMEKQIQAKLDEAEALSKTTSKLQEAPAGIEPAKLVSLLPTLREWVKTLKKDQTYEPAMMKLMEGYCLPREHNRTEALRPRTTNEKLLQSDDSHKLFGTVVQSLVQEVQALQRELGKLGSRNWKHKSSSLPWRTGLENKPGGRATSAGSPPLKARRFYNR